MLDLGPFLLHEAQNMYPLVRVYFLEKKLFLNWGASFRIHFEKIRIRGFSGVLNPNPIEDF